jgi:RimJ/RimL family protein N-acetyltransferase
VEIPTLTTGRLELRAPGDGDLAMLRAYESDAEAMRYIGEGVTHPLEHAEATLAGFLAEWPRVGHGRWNVALRESGEPIGNCGFVRWREGEEDSRPELAYGYVRAAWGRGYATEAAGAALDWAWAVLPFDEIVALTHPENAASQRVLAKLGFEAAGEVVPSHGRRLAYYRLGRPGAAPPSPG